MIAPGEFQRDDTPGTAAAETLHPQHIRRVYPATEYVPINIPLEDLLTGNHLYLYPEVTGKNYFHVYLRKDHLVFQAGGFIGLIPINDRVAIDVRPRVPIHNLEHILRIAEQVPISLAPHVRRYGSHHESAPSLIDLFAEALVNAVGEIEMQGVHRAYSQQTMDTSFPRGRVLVGETIRRHRAGGAYHRANAAWFVQSTDTAPNRCIKYALWYLAQRYKSMMPRTGMRRMLTRLDLAYHVFAGAELDLTKRFLDDPLVTNPDRLPSIRAYYKQAIYLAVTIVRDRGVALTDRGDQIEMASLLINLEDTFESYLRATLRSQLESILPGIQVLDGNKAGASGGQKTLFDPGFADDLATIMATPDIVCRYSGSDEKTTFFPLILDAKYKDIQNLADREDLNQAIGYGTSYRAPSVVLVYPYNQKLTRGLHSLGRIGSMRLYQYVIDLAADLIREEQAFVISMSDLVSSASR